MVQPKYRVGDMVQICEEPWNQHAGDFVFITKVTDHGDCVSYEFLIPQSSGSVPEKMIKRVVSYGFDIEKLRK